LAPAAKAKSLFIDRVAFFSSFVPASAFFDFQEQLREPSWQAALALRSSGEVRLPWKNLAFPQNSEKRCSLPV
jgi:hypothetical protein